MMARSGLTARRAPWGSRQEVLRASLLALLALLTALAVIQLARALSVAWQVWLLPFQVDDSEGVILAESVLLGHGIDIYALARPDFFTAAAYTPIFYILNAVPVALLGPTFKVGRAIAFLATLGIGVAVYDLARGASGSRRGGWAAAGVFAGLTLVAIWSIRMRPDPLALLFHLLGIRSLLAAESDSWPRLLGGKGSRVGRMVTARLPAWSRAAVWFALAFYTKQIPLAAPLAAGLYLLLRRPRRALAFASTYAGLVVFPFLVLELLTGGGFAQHLGGFHGSWSSGAFLRMFVPFLETHWPLLAAALLGGAAVAFDARPQLLAIYAVLALAMSVTVGTDGGNHNHFLETLAAGSVLAGVGIGLGAGRPASARTLLALVGAALLVAQLALLLATPEWLRREARAPLPAQVAGLQQVAQYVTNTPGEVYSLDVGLLAAAGKPTRFTDPFTMTFAAGAGQWDESGLVRDLRAGRFSLVVLRSDLTLGDQRSGDLSPGVYQAILERYQLVERNVLFLYAPR